MIKNQCRKKELFFYKIFNLVLASQLECPELISIEPQTPDVTVVVGQVPSHLPTIEKQKKNIQINSTQLLFKVDKIATFLVENGRKITISPDVQPKPKHLIRLFLLGSAIGAAQHQRNRLTLHASALTNGVETIVICGRSGAGKSTTGNQLIQHGYQLISDDVAVIDFKENNAWVMPAYPQSKIWADAANMLKIRTNNLNKIRKNFNKFAFPLEKHFYSKPSKVSKIIMLEKKPISAPVKQGLSLVEKAFYLKKHTYKKKYLSLEQVHGNFEQCARLISTTPIIKLERPEARNSLEEVGKLLLNKVHMC